MRACPQAVVSMNAYERSPLPFSNGIGQGVTEKLGGKGGGGFLISNGEGETERDMAFLGLKCKY